MKISAVEFVSLLAPKDRIDLVAVVVEMMPVEDTIEGLKQGLSSHELGQVSLALAGER